MNCEEVRDLLSPYLDRELTGDEMTDIATHLENCPDCMNKSTVFSQLSRIIQHWEGIKASEDAKAVLTAKIRGAQTQKRSGRSPTVIVLLLLVGALLLGGIAALLVWMLGGGSAAAGPITARCEAIRGRVEIVSGSAVTAAESSAELADGQILRCPPGTAVQVVTSGPENARFVMRGPASLMLKASGVQLRSGALAFHLKALAADVSRVLIAAGAFRVEPEKDVEVVGLLSISGDGSVRLAVLSGGARLAGLSGSAGIPVKPGSEISIRPDGSLAAPGRVSAGEEFELIKHAQ